MTILKGLLFTFSMTPEGSFLVFGQFFASQKDLLKDTSYYGAVPNVSLGNTEMPGNDEACIPDWHINNGQCGEMLPSKENQTVPFAQAFRKR